MKFLVRFHWYVRRMGDVEGLFVCTQEEYDDLIGQEVYFGEILGKHSEIYGTIDEDDLKILSDDQDKIDWLVSVCGRNISGYNPMDYIRENDEELEEDTEDGEV